MGDLRTVAAVTLVTWLGVFFYVLRLEKRVRELERK